MEKIMDNTILCVKWGDKYGREYVEKLKEQCEKNCSVPFNFYCFANMAPQAKPLCWGDLYRHSV